MIRTNIKPKNFNLREIITFGLLIFMGLILFGSTAFWSGYQFQWYQLLSISLFIFLINISESASKDFKFYITMFILVEVGSILSIIRSGDTISQLRMIGQTGVNYLIIGLLIPSLIAPRARWAIIISIFIAGFQLAINVTQVRSLGGFEETLYYLSGENDKNALAFVFILCITISLMAWLINIDVNNKILKLIINNIVFYTSIIFSLFISYTYSRSGLIVAVLSIIIIFLLYLFKENVTKIKILLFIITLLGGVYFFWANLRNLSPLWFGSFSPLEYGNRWPLIEKAIYLIMQNPILGNGIGNTRSSAVDLVTSIKYPRGMIHNLYLTTWAEIGLLGLLMYVLWIKEYIVMIIYKYDLLTFIDKITLIMMIPFFLMLLFLDLGSTSLFMLAIFTGLLIHVRNLTEN